MGDVLTNNHAKKESEKEMLRSITVMAAILVLSGCASTPLAKRALSGEARAALKEQRVSQTTRQKPSFVAMTGDKALLGALGAGAAISQGNTLVEKHGLEDPAVTISRGLAASLQQVHVMQVEEGTVAVKGRDAAQLAAQANPAAPYLLDVQTLGWGFNYYAMSWGKYWIAYSAKAVLIDTRTKTVVAESFCSLGAGESEGAPSYDDLINNQAEGLKKELGRAAQQCLATMKRDMLEI